MPFCSPNHSNYFKAPIVQMEIDAEAEIFVTGDAEGNVKLHRLRGDAIGSVLLVLKSMYILVLSFV
jgi:hypothetical protein